MTHRIAMQCGDMIVKGDIASVGKVARWSVMQKYKYNLDDRWCAMLHIIKYKIMCNKGFEIIKSNAVLKACNARCP
jgi:hypothetical protein